MNLDYLTIVLVIIVFCLLYYLSSRYLYNHFLKKINSKGIDGREIASEIIGGENLILTLNQESKPFKNYVDIKNSTLVLSNKILTRSSITALAIIPYELIIYESYLKSNFVLVVKQIINTFVLLASSIGILLILFSLIFHDTNMYNAGILTFFSTLILVLVSFPHAVITSINSKKLLEKYSLISESDNLGVNLLLIFLSLASLNLLVSLMVITIDYILESLDIKLK